MDSKLSVEDWRCQDLQGDWWWELHVSPSRYVDLSLDEDTLIRKGQHVLVTYKMKAKEGSSYVATAAHFAEVSMGTNVNMCTTDDFTKPLDALVYYIDPDNEEVKIAYPTLLFDRNIADGCGMMCSLTLAIGNQGMGDVDAKMHDFYVPSALLHLYDGPSTNMEDTRRMGGTSNGIEAKLGLQPKPFSEKEEVQLKAMVSEESTGAPGSSEEDSSDDFSLSNGVIEYAKTHEEIKGAFLTLQKDAEQIYPGWEEKLGYTCPVVEALEKTFGAEAEEGGSSDGDLNEDETAPSAAEPPSRPLQVSVKRAGKTIIVEVEEGDTIDELKAKIGEKEGVPPMAPPGSYQMNACILEVVKDVWRILGRDKPTLGLQPKPFGEVCYSFFQGGDLIKNDESDECLPEELKDGEESCADSFSDSSSEESEEYFPVSWTHVTPGKARPRSKSWAGETEQELLELLRGVAVPAEEFDHTIDEKTAIRNGEHVLVTYAMKPKAGCDYGDAAEEMFNNHLHLGVLVVEEEPLELAYPALDFGDIMHSLLLSLLDQVDRVKDLEVSSLYLPPAFLRLYEPSIVEDVWRILGRDRDGAKLRKLRKLRKL